MGFGAVVIASCSGPHSIVSPKYIMERLGETLPLRWSDESRQLPLVDPSEDGTVDQLSNSKLQRLGRAHNVIAEDDITFPETQDDLDLPCPWAVRSAALTPQNHLVACCGMEAENNEVLDFGDVTTATPDDLVTRADDNLIVNAIAFAGPYQLKRFIQGIDPSVPFRDRYGSVCEMCEHIVSRPEAVAVLRRNAALIAPSVLKARAEKEAAARA
jgi:hypothetical protein